MQIFTSQPGRGQLLAIWIIALAMIGLLGVLRENTDVEYTFTAATIIPIIFVSWAGGLGHGLVASSLAALMWLLTDVLSGHEFNEIWIPYLNGLTRLAAYGFVAYLIARVRTLLLREIKFATHDALTGLMNRRVFIETGEIEASRSERYAHPMAVVFLDLDNFKKLNDSRGHAAGDGALKAVAAALKQMLRATDTVARMGGDEFAVMLPEIDQNAARDAGNKIAAAIATALKSFPPVTASLGIAWFARDGDGFAGMLKAADALMYEMKQDGKGGIRMKAFS